jgi:excinuclease UvrABC nuclease subunit
MARVRGVVPTDGARMRNAIMAVLSGDPDEARVVTTELLQRRQAAVDALDFERAAALQRELEGLGWILEPSRVLQAGLDLDLHGWADGVLFTFEVREGRVRDWRARPCTERDAEPRIQGTPDRWRTFADENAALAAALGSISAG